MKMLIIFFVGLLLGLGLGSVFTLRHADHEVAAVVAQMQQPYEASERLDAIRSIRVIELIQSGDSSNALRVLSEPIAEYYSINAKLVNNDDRTRKTLNLIEGFARTNQFIGETITNWMQGRY